MRERKLTGAGPYRARPPVYALGLVVTMMIAGCHSAPQDGRVRIGGLVFQEDQYMRLVQVGMREEAKKRNVELMMNNTFNTLDKEISLIDTYLANQVRAVVVAPLSSKGSVAALKRAHDEGVVVVTFDNFIEADFPAAGIRSDQRDLGRKSGEAAAKYIQEKLGGQAQVALVTSITVSPELGQQRVDGFQTEVTKLPGVKVVVQQDASLAPEATIVVENMLTAHPEINLIWAGNEGGTVGAVTAIVNKGKAGKVAVFGTDMSEQIGSFLLASEGVLQAVTGQKPFEIGQRALAAAVDTLDHKPVEKNVALPGILFSRDKPEEVKAYVDFLKKVSQ